MAAHDALSSVLVRITDQWPSSAAAHELAAAGVPVFPCTPGGKQPATTHGFHDATTDPAQVEAWWRDRPAANIGIPTGAASGVVVVDIDVHGPVNGYEAMQRAHLAGLTDGWMFLVATPSGGTHAYYPASPEVEQRSWQAARAGIDFRGDGGYIIVPPSAIHAEGRSVPYAVREINPGPAQTVESDALREFLDPRPTPRPRSAAGLSREGRGDVDRIAAWVAGRVEGERNRGVFWAACRLAENGIAPSDALDVLTAAAGDAGLSEREVTATVRSAYRTASAPSSPRATQPREQTRPFGLAWGRDRAPSSPGRGLA